MPISFPFTVCFETEQRLETKLLSAARTTNTQMYLLKGSMPCTLYVVKICVNASILCKNQDDYVISLFWFQNPLAETAHHIFQTNNI